MDDPKLRPTAFPRAASTSAPGRVRPGRPIPFEPLPRLTPSAPPTWITEQPKTPSIAGHLARIGVWALLALGWLVFASWWVIVLTRESTASLGRAAGLLGAILVTCTVVMLAWTRYNIWIARRGKRGHSSLYIPMEWNHDTLGRPIELPAGAVAQSASELRIVIRDGVKAYVDAGEGTL